MKKQHLLSHGCRALLCSIFLLAICAGVVAQDQGRTRDVVLVLDSSGSMNDEDIFQDVKDYIAWDILRTMVRPGDRFTLLSFGEGARREFTVVPQDEAALKDLANRVQALSATEDFTDLGLALEALDTALEDHSNATMLPVAVFITDGKNAPSWNSPWRGKDLSLDEHFIGIGEKIAKKGWVLYVVGLGEESDAALVADAVPGSVLSDSTDALEAENLQTHIQEREENLPPQATGLTDKPEGDTASSVAETSQNPSAEQQESAPLPLLRIALIGGIAAMFFLILMLLLLKRKKAERKEKTS